MKSGKCPKCGSENIYQNPRSSVGLTGSLIVVKLGLMISKSAGLIHYVCDDCQYVESYIANEASMKNIREEWTPMNPRKSKRKNDES